MKTPEWYEKDEIRKRFDSLKPHVKYNITRMSGWGENGVSDIVGCYRSQYFAVEVKRPGKEPTPVQWRRINETTEAGGKAFWGTAEKVIQEFEAWIA